MSSELGWSLELVKQNLCKSNDRVYILFISSGDLHVSIVSFNMWNLIPFFEVHTHNWIPYSQTQVDEDWQSLFFRLNGSFSAFYGPW